MDKTDRGQTEKILRCFKYLHFVMSIVLFMVTWFIYIKVYRIHFDSRYNYFVAAMYTAVLYVLSRIYNCYLVGYSSAKDIGFSQCITSFLSTAALYFSTMLVWNKWKNPLPFVVLVPIQWILNILWAKIADKMYFKFNPPKKTALIYRSDFDVRRLKELLAYVHSFDMAVKMQVNENTSINDIIAEIGDCDVVFITGVAATLRNGIVKHCVENHLQTFVLPHVGDVIMSGAEHVQSFSTPVLAIKGGSMTPEYRVVKRLFDIVVSSAALVCLSPLMLITAIAIKIEDGGPVFYRQTRLTKNAKEFRIIKFRSMKTDAEKDGVARLAAENDARITKVGRTIRACRIDELPQLINVIKGDMSLVGPRPERPEIAAEYEKVLPAFRLRLQVKAGVTGYAQVYGKYNTDPQDKLLFDLLYINHMNSVTDLQLLFATIKILFSKESTEGIENGLTTARGDIDEQ